MKRPGIDLLLSKYCDRETTAAEGQIVEERLRTDPGCALQMKQMKALGCVLDIAVEGLRPDENLLANIMGRATAEAALHRKPAISVPMPSRILEAPRPARRAVPVWLKAVAAAAVVMLVALGVLMLAVFPPAKPAALSVAARETHGDVRIIAAQSKQSRAIGKTDVLLAGDAVSVGEGKADIATDEWNCRLNSNTAITYVATADKSITLEMSGEELWVENSVKSPKNTLQIKTAFGTILASDANFDVKVENIAVPAAASALRNEPASIFETCFVLCGDAVPQEAPPAPKPPEKPYVPVPKQSVQQTSPPAPIMQNVTRITIAVSRGSVTYMRGGTSYLLDANRVVQEDTSGRFHAKYLKAEDVRKLLNWWESGTVSTPDIEALSPPAPPTSPPAPSENNAPPDNNAPLLPEPEKGKPAPNEESPKGNAGDTQGKGKG